jgi:Na+/proline symporter
MFGNWIAGIVLIYSFLFGTGSFLFGESIEALFFLIAALVSIIIIYRNLSAAGWKTLIK